MAEGEQVLNDLEGALEEARLRGIEVLPTLVAFGAAAPVEEPVFATPSDRLLNLIRDVQGRFDAAYLPAARRDGHHRAGRCGGELVNAIRFLMGSTGPIVVSLELHFHVTDDMVEGADVIVGYRTCPHTDVRRNGHAGHAAARRHAHGSHDPTTRQHQVRLSTSAEAHDTTDGPLATFQPRVPEIERESAVIAVSVFTTQPWMDAQGVGWSVTATPHGDPDLARHHADALAREAWAARERYHVVKTTIADALESARAYVPSAGRWSGPTEQTS